VVTKCDRVDAARLEQVQAQVRELLAGTALAGAPVLAVSAAQGQGVAALREALAAAAAAQQRRSTEGRLLRIAVDRSFTVAGSGTVVTGTVFDGAVKTGDRVRVSPSGTEVRVRGLQKDGRAAGHA